MDNCRTLVYVEGDATMSSYNDAEGKPRTALNIVQSKLIPSNSSFHSSSSLTYLLPQTDLKFSHQRSPPSLRRYEITYSPTIHPCNE
jgi:single-stranded DNA-binding protein